MPNPSAQSLLLDTKPLSAADLLAASRASPALKSAAHNSGSVGEDCVLTRREAAEFVIDGYRKVTFSRKADRYIVEGAAE